MESVKAKRMDAKWDHDSGHIALDYINTLEWRNGKSPNDRLTRVPDLIDWAEESMLIDMKAAQKMRTAILMNPEGARSWFDRILQMRETIYRILSAISASESPPEEDFVDFNAALAQSLGQSRLMRENDHYRWAWQGGADSLELLLWSIVRSTADLLTSPELHKLGECADDRGCAYLFVDESRNHSRRWCSMESCGNRAKARRHYRRTSTKE